MEFTGERMIPEFNKGQEIYLEHMIRYLFASKFVKDKVVLDIACGSGYGAKELLDAGAKKVIGVDISEETIEYCKKNYQNENIEFLVGGVEKIPLEDNSMDVIVSFETIEHIDEKAQKLFLKESKRVLRKNGVFIVSTPNSDFYPSGNEFHIKEFNEKEFKNLLKMYFSNVEFYYQSDELGQSIYITASCSDSQNVSREQGATYFSKINIVSFVGQTEDFKKEIQSKDQEIQSKNQEIKSKNREIAFMEASKFWKLREKYINLKSKLKMK